MSYAVLVIDMAQTGEGDGRVVDGFASFEAERAYAGARTRLGSGQAAKKSLSLFEFQGSDSDGAAADTDRLGECRN